MKGKQVGLKFRIIYLATYFDISLSVNFMPYKFFKCFFFISLNFYLIRILKLSIVNFIGDKKV